MAIDIQLKKFEKYLDDNLPSLGNLDGLSQDEIRKKFITFFTEGATETTSFDENLYNRVIKRVLLWLIEEKKIDNDVAYEYIKPLHEMETDEWDERFDRMLNRGEKEEKKIIKFPIK